ncbi:MAG: 3-dehydroquinate synthase, partial [Cyanobacteria bacterium J06641_5]
MEAIVSVPLPQNPYEVQIVPGGLANLGDRLQVIGSGDRPGKPLGQKILLVSNPEIYGHYGERAIASLQGAGFNVGYHEIPAGEPHKTLQSIEKVYDTCLSLRLERSSTLVALGGGVIGDMTGFAAA